MDQVLGTGMVYSSVYLDWVVDAGVAHGQKAGVTLPPNLVFGQP